MLRLITGLTFLLLLPAFHCQLRAAERPNFVVIFIDDMGYGDIEPFGSKLNQTPHLNRMAAEGLKLTSFYAAPVCSASRAQLLTGCYAPRVSVPGVFFPAGAHGLNPDERTIAEYLRDAGYATMCVGKWHLGDQPAFLPTNQGFEHYFGIPYSNDMQRVSRVTGKRVTPLLRDDVVAELLEDEGQRRVTRAYTEEAIRFIRQHRDQPFFLYLPHTAMHVPLFPHQDFVGKSQNGVYGDWVQEVDWSVGQVLNTLRELDLAKNTLVLFTSDNGPWASKGKAGGISGHLRGSKGCTLEGGVREPTLCWWPDTIKAGRVSDAIVGTTDVLPTLTSLAGVKLDQRRKIDGVDASPLLLGTTNDSPRTTWHYFKGTQLKAVRSGPWKLALSAQTLGMGIREKPADLSSPQMRLYNLQEDLGEVNDVAGQHPEVVARLTELAAAMKADIGSGSPGPGVRPAGKVDKPQTLYPTNRTNKRSSTPRRSKKPIDWSRVRSGDTFGPESAPLIAQRSLEIKCSLTPAGTQQPAGVVVAHGGSAVGYSLYVQDEKLSFAVRKSVNEIVRLQVKLPPSDHWEINARVDKQGVMSLAVNQTARVETPLKSLLSKEPQEDLCIGHDNANPVDMLVTKRNFVGKLVKLQVITAR